MQAQYPNKSPLTHWDSVHIDYPVRKFPSTELSSETIGRRWRRSPQKIVKNLKEPIEEINNYFRDYNVTRELTRSQTAIDFGYKQPETKRFNKHVTCIENRYIYPPSRKLNERTPQCNAHGKTETQSSYVIPTIPSRFETERNQLKHSASIPLDSFPVEINCKNNIEPIDTTHEGYEKYLDPYLTTNRLNHRPYTADQLERVSCSKDVVTYYTYANVPWIRTPLPKTDQWQLPHKRPKPTYDREKFKRAFREITTHNKLKFVPGTFSTETREKYKLPTSISASEVHNNEEEVKNYYKVMITGLQSNIEKETSNILNKYTTENSFYGSKRPLCSLFNPFVEESGRPKK